MIGGTLTFSVLSMSANVIDLHRAGKIRVVAVTSADRSDAAPDFPTALEQGFPGMVVLFFVGLFAPAGVPPEILAQLDQVTQAAMRNQALRTLLAQAGFEIPYSNRSEATAFLRNEIAKWAPILESQACVRNSGALSKCRRQSPVSGAAGCERRVSCEAKVLLCQVAFSWR